MFLLGNVGNQTQGNLNEKLHADFPQIKAASSLELELSLAANSDLPGGDMMVYKVLSPHVTAQYVENIGEKFGFVDGAGAADSSSVGMVDKKGETTRTLKVFTNSGGIEYLLPDKWFPVVEAQPALPSKEEAENIAVDFLRKLDLLPADYNGIEVKDDSTQTNVSVKDGIEYKEEFVVGRHVIFQREIDGKPVMGPGQKLKVFVGENGITGAIILWREIEPYQKLPLKTIDQAITALKQGKHGTYSVPAEATQAIIKDIRLGYWMSPATHYQEYVVPVYEVAGICLDKDGNEIGSFQGWCEAL